MDFEAHGFGRRVAAAREWAGLKPKQLAERLGVSPEAVYRLERGARLTPPRRAELRLLAEVLEQSEDWLLRGEQPPWTQEPGDLPSEPALHVALAELAGFAVEAKDLLVEHSTRLQAIEERLGAIEDRLEPPERQGQSAR